MPYSTVILQVTVAGFTLLSPSWSFQLSDISPDFISHKLVNRLGIDKFQRRLSFDSITDLVGNKFDAAGYITFNDAARRCEAGARGQVERTLQRLQREALKVFMRVGTDLEARCRSYIEYAGNDCRSRLESVGEELLESGRELVNSENDRCRAEIEELSERVQREEEERYRLIGDAETQNLTEVYTELGKVEERKIRSEFEERQLNVTEQLTEELTNRGLTERDRIVREFEALGEAARANVTLDVSMRGFNLSEEIRKEFEDRGEKFEADLRAEFERRGEEARIEIEERYRSLGEDEQKSGEQTCDCMLMNACENVKQGSSADVNICRGVFERLVGVDCDNLNKNKDGEDTNNDYIDDGLRRRRQSLL